jgi:hypothetical protein
MLPRDSSPPTSGTSPGRNHVWLAKLGHLGVNLAAGLVAALLTIFCMLSLRAIAGIPTPVELSGFFVLKHLDANTFVTMLIRFSPNQKSAPLGLALLGMFGLGTTLGPAYARLARVPRPLNSRRPARREWLLMLSIALFLTALGSGLY